MAGVGHSLVTGKGECLAGSSGQDGYASGDEKNNNDERHGSGAALGARSSIKDLDERIARLGSKRSLEVDNAEAVGHGHHEAQDAVQYGGGNHTARDNA